MEKKSIDLCSMNGVDVASALVEKLYNPLHVELRLGSVVLKRISGITHSAKDGQPVVEAEDSRGEPFIFQFYPNETPFGLSAVGLDGQPICPQAS